MSKPNSNSTSIFSAKLTIENDRREMICQAADKNHWEFSALLMFSESSQRFGVKLSEYFVP